MIFLTWNPGEKILHSIESVRSQSYDDLEIVVVDNDSTDGTPDRLRSEFPDEDRLRIFENETNLGFANGIEVGMRESDGEYLCCYNHDTTFAEGYFETVADYVSEDAVWTTARENHRVSKSTKCARLNSPYGFSVPYDVDSLSGVAKVNYVPGDGVIIPRTIYEKTLNGIVFEEKFAPRCEDVNLALRLQDAGVDIYAILDTYSIHPDKADFYAPNIENFLTLLGTTRARVRTFRANGRPGRAILAAFSLLTNPVLVYLRPVPRSTAAFRNRAELVSRHD
ncbi:glycosyltransferase family 2 protein [Halapricum salinum]|uniref:glycosyltransferase family 2 protein n=1 Tax=Halapricum salinum TaxID=1457250 RepID=UPI001F2182B9|nr:glycosyltransferase family 2 protein [Halapricum salinum]